MPSLAIVCSKRTFHIYIYIYISSYTSAYIWGTLLRRTTYEIGIIIPNSFSLEWRLSRLEKSSSPEHPTTWPEKMWLHSSVCNILQDVCAACDTPVVCRPEAYLLGVLCSACHHSQPLSVFYPWYQIRDKSAQHRLASIWNWLPERYFRRPARLRNMNGIACCLFGLFIPATSKVIAG